MADLHLPLYLAPWLNIFKQQAYLQSVLILAHYLILHNFSIHLFVNNISSPTGYLTGFGIGKQVFIKTFVGILVYMYMYASGNTCSKYGK